MFKALTATILAAALFAAGCTSGGDPSGDVTESTVGGSSGTVTTVAVETTTSTAPTTTTTDPFGEIVVAPPPEEGSIVELAGHGPVALGRISVMFTDDATPDQVDAVAAALGGSVIGVLEFIDLYEFDLPEKTPESSTAAVAMVSDMPGVQEAFIDHPVFPGSSECVSTSPLSSPQYGENDSGENYEAIGVPEAWDIIQMSGIKLNKVHVGVVDTAIEDENSELSGSPITQDFNDTENQPSSAAVENQGADEGIKHGTAVTNVIGANPDNGGVVGVASVLREKLTITTDDIYAGPEWVPATDAENPATSQWSDGAFTNTSLAKVLKQVKAGATVINMSYGPTKPLATNRPVADVYRKFFTKMQKMYPKVVFVAAAGNEEGALDGANYFPGGMALPNVITVGAIDKNGEKASFTNTEAGGSAGEVTLAAPGVKIPVGVDEATGTTEVMSGTSFATPMVTSSIALIHSINPDLSAAEIKDLLVRTAYAGVPSPSGDTSKLIPASLGGGVLRVDEAVLAAINDMRAKATPPLDAVTKEGLLALAAFHVEEQPVGSGEFTVTASVDAVSDEATLSFELFDEGAVRGNSHVTLGAPGDAAWDVTLADPTVIGSAKICRVEASRCCVVELKSPDIPGTYDGALILEEVEAAGDVVIDLGDAGTQTITKEECEQSVGDALGATVMTLVVTLAGEPGATSGMASGTITTSDGEAQPFEPTPWTFDGTSVSFAMAAPSDGGASPGTIVISGGIVDVDQQGNVSIVGPWSLSGVSNLNLGGTATLTKRGGG